MNIGFSCNMQPPNVLINPRLTDYHGISVAQEEVDFAIPFFDSDIPLYVDPFLLWKSPSQMDKALHQSLVHGFNSIITSSLKDESSAVANLVSASECHEIGLGSSGSRRGKEISKRLAEKIIHLCDTVPQIRSKGITHLEELQLLVDGIGKDRTSDFACSFLKSFLIDFTMDQCERLNIPTQDVTVDNVYQPLSSSFQSGVRAKLPVHPELHFPLLLAPKRWLRFKPWISFDDYFQSACPQDDVAHDGEELTRVHVLNFNRDNYGIVQQYIQAKELSERECTNDPLFTQLPVASAKQKAKMLERLPTGKQNGADKKYEDLIVQLMSTLVYPFLDFAADQVRTDSGAQIRDLAFYNTQAHSFLTDIFRDYQSRQIVFEIKNVAEVDRDHVNQLNRYLSGALGNFGVLVTRKPLKRSIQQNLIDLWSGQRRCIIALVDADIHQMVDLFESKQRDPLDVIIKNNVQFRRTCPS